MLKLATTLFGNLFDIFGYKSLSKKGNKNLSEEDSNLYVPYDVFKHSIPPERKFYVEIELPSTTIESHEEKKKLCTCGREVVK